MKKWPVIDEWPQQGRNHSIPAGELSLFERDWLTYMEPRIDREGGT